MWFPSQLAFRRKLYERDAGICKICNRAVDFETMHLDHVVPKSKDGPTSEDNLRIAHRRCNIARNNREDWSPPDGWPERPSPAPTTYKLRPSSILPLVPGLDVISKEKARQALECGPGIIYRLANEGRLRLYRDTNRRKVWVGRKELADLYDLNSEYRDVLRRLSNPLSDELGFD